MILSSVDEGLSRRTRRAHTQVSEFIKGSSMLRPLKTSTAPLELSPTSPISSKRRGKQRATAAELELPDVPATGAISASPPRKRRKTITISIPDNTAETVPPSRPTLDPSENVSAQNHNRTTRSSRRRSGAPVAALTTIQDLPPKSRKVILRVTEPESALDQLLQSSSEPIPHSLIGLSGKKGALVSKLEAHAKAVSALAEKRAEFRRKGWYLPLNRNGERRRGPPEEPERSADTWDATLRAVEAAYQPITPRLAVTKRICEAIAARTELNLYGQVKQGRPVRGAGKTRGSKKQKDDPETAWRKKLAKATLGLVVDHWKRVVLVSAVRTFLQVRAHAYDLF